MFSHFAFGTSAPKAKVLDHNKPIYVNSGADTAESIGWLQSDTTSLPRAADSIHLWKNAFCDYFEQKEGDSMERTNDEQQLFREPVIDSLIAQKEKVTIMELYEPYMHHGCTAIIYEWCT
ncbi:hypothetical protein KIN20_003177 [Parelaphostrongylus tenuis]|uniref:Uncharacterized protein n=1 Tax=Parelaphostrongylus tenuis TaxID=148309 RepID=A0AAD5LYR7_PARTN|nr:hypothetical protein KIN20_003177 [Parelaphostrongylus tenuis]